jgi:hypothetical protein
MRFLRKRCIDYENVPLQLHFQGPPPGGEQRLEAFFRNWLDERQRRGICRCERKDLSIRMSPAGDAAEVLCGWCCEACLAHLKKVLPKGLAGINRVVVGTDAGPYPAADKRFVAVGPKAVAFEDGTAVEVPEFRICRSPVTVGDFRGFTTQTGYVTTAEEGGDGVSFRRNEVVEAVRPGDRGNVPVSVVSFTDALAYCRWAGVHLPTEAEWLAASIIDERIFDREAGHRFLFGDLGRFQIDRFPTALAGLAAEWVVGEAPAGEAVVRYGPCYIREVGWESRPQRSVWPAGSYDLTVGFRVVGP